MEYYQQHKLDNLDEIDQYCPKLFSKARLPWYHKQIEVVQEREREKERTNERTDRLQISIS